MHDTEGETIESLKRERDEAKANISALDEHWLRKFADETAARDKAERERGELSRTVAACVEHIDVVERILGDHEEEGGVFIPRADLPKRFSHRDGDYLAVTHTVSAGTYAKRVDERDAERVIREVRKDFEGIVASLQEKLDEKTRGLEMANVRLRDTLHDIREWSKPEHILRFDDGDIALADYITNALKKRKP
jgi:hypothetical protein